MKQVGFMCVMVSSSSRTQYWLTERSAYLKPRQKTHNIRHIMHLHGRLRTEEDVGRPENQNKML